MRKTNFKHGLGSREFASSSPNSVNQVVLPSAGERAAFQQSVITQSTIDVQIDKGALQNRKEMHGDEAIKKFVQARKTEQRLREAHKSCAEFIENDSELELLDYLKANSDLSVFDIVDPDGKTLLHECTFNDSTKCTKALISLARDQTTTVQ